MRDIVCTGCSLLCDDVEVGTEKKEVTSLGLCRLGHAHTSFMMSHTEDRGIIRKDSAEKRVALNEALDYAAEILASSEKTVVFGGTASATEAIKESREIAEVLEAQFETLTGLGLQQSLIHTDNLGIDLEHVRNFGELIIYWGSNPTESLHRHPSRFAVLPSGEKIPEGVESRTIGVVDVRESETMKMANHRFIIPPGGDSELLEVLATEITGSSSITEAVQGIPAVEILGLVRAFKKADCTIIFYGSGVVNSGHFEKNMSGMKNLINSLRTAGKEAYALPLYPNPNVMGAVEESNSTNLNAITKVQHDCTLIIGDDVLAETPGYIAKKLRKSRIVYIGSPGGLSDRFAEVSIHVANPIVSGEGSMMRIDKKRFEFPKATDRSHHSTEQVLKDLGEKIEKLK
jgi:formylmethanofuran dehydrogenase subunit B